MNQVSTQHFIRHFPQFWIIPLFFPLLLNNYACIDSEYTVMQYNVIYNAPRSGFFHPCFICAADIHSQTCIRRRNTSPQSLFMWWINDTSFWGEKKNHMPCNTFFFPFLQTPIYSVQSFFIVTNPRRASIQRILETNQLTNDLQNPLYIYIKTI